MWLFHSNTCRVVSSWLIVSNLVQVKLPVFCSPSIVSVYCKIHATNGYLIDQFLKDSSNKQTDNYSGSLKNRFRFLREIVVACQQAIGKDKLNIRPRDHRSTRWRAQ